MIFQINPRPIVSIYTPSIYVYIYIYIYMSCRAAIDLYITTMYPYMNHKMSYTQSPKLYVSLQVWYRMLYASNHDPNTLKPEPSALDPKLKTLGPKPGS